MKQLTRAVQQLLTLRAAELVRPHGADEAVAGGAGVLLQDQLAALGQRDALRPQPTQQAPDRAVVQTPLFRDGRVSRLLIAGRSTSRARCLAVGLRGVLQVAAGKMQEGLAGVTLIGEYESRGNP